MLKYLFAAALLAAPLTAAAQSEDLPDWYYINTTRSSTVIYARTQDLAKGRAHQSDARVWLLFDHAKDKSVNWRETKVYYTFDCNRQTFRALSLIVYFPDGRSEQGNPPGEIEYVIPDSNMDTVAQLLCYTPTEKSPTSYVPDKHTI